MQSHQTLPLHTLPGRAPAKAGAGLGPLLLVAALGALAGGYLTLASARASATSVVNDVCTIAFVVNGAAVILLPVALWKLLQTRGLVAGLVVASLWAGGAGFLLNGSIDDNRAASNLRWENNRLIADLHTMCSGAKQSEPRAKAYDPHATKHEVVWATEGAHGAGPRASAKESLRIEDADLIACTTEVEKTVERCTYEGYRVMQRVQVSSNIRFLSIKTGELVWETTLEGPMPRACGESERMPAHGGTIRGTAPNPQFAYDEHFGRKK